MIKKIFIIANLEKERSAKAYKETVSILRKKHISVLDNEDISKAQLVITLGGDGMVLRSAQNIQNRIPVLAVNLGSLGFLSQINFREFKNNLSQILKGEFSKENRMMLSCKVDALSLKALNDFVIERTDHRAVSFNVILNNKEFMSYLGDGLVVASPTGSTAYSLAVGGPIVDPSIEAIILSPISAHTLLNRPLIIGRDKSVEIVANSDIFLTIDGQQKIEVKKGRKVRITRSNKCFTLARIDGMGNFFDSLQNKFYRSRMQRD